MFINSDKYTNSLLFPYVGLRQEAVVGFYRFKKERKKSCFVTPEIHYTLIAGAIPPLRRTLPSGEQSDALIVKVSRRWGLWKRTVRRLKLTGKVELDLGKILLGHGENITTIGQINISSTHIQGHVLRFAFLKSCQNGSVITL